MTAMTTAAETTRCVQMWADCPSCGRRCMWVGRATDTGSGTNWRIHCRRCVKWLGQVK